LGVVESQYRRQLWYRSRRLTTWSAAFHRRSIPISSVVLIGKVSCIVFRCETIDSQLVFAVHGLKLLLETLEEQAKHRSWKLTITNCIRINMWAAWIARKLPGVVPAAAHPVYFLYGILMSEINRKIAKLT
jgi:hypothetical protein